MTNPTSEAMEAGLRAVREMADGQAPANDAPDAAGDDARVEAIMQALDKSKAHVVADSYENMLAHMAFDVIAADPATSRIRELEERIDVLLGTKGMAVTAGMMLVEGIVAAEKRQQALEEANRALVEEVRKVERHIRLCAYTSAGDPQRADDMKMFGVWAARLQAAIGEPS